MAKEEKKCEFKALDKLFEDVYSYIQELEDERKTQSEVEYNKLTDAYNRGQSNTALHIFKLAAQAYSNAKK